MVSIPFFSIFTWRYFYGVSFPQQTRTSHGKISRPTRRQRYRRQPRNILPHPRIKSSQSPERKLRCSRTGLCLFFAIFSRQPRKIRCRYHHCSDCKLRSFPVDVTLGLPKRYTYRLKRMAARCVGQTSYEIARGNLAEETAGKNCGTFEEQFRCLLGHLSCGGTEGVVQAYA